MCLLCLRGLQRHFFKNFGHFKPCKLLCFRHFAGYYLELYADSTLTSVTSV